jgi:hypothetical protein
MLTLLLTFAEQWAKNQGVNKLREFAASPTPDLTLKWKKFRYGVWVAEGNASPKAGLRRLGRISVQGVDFSLW